MPWPPSQTPGSSRTNRSCSGSSTSGSACGSLRQRPLPRGSAGDPPEGDPGLMEMGPGGRDPVPGQREELAGRRLLESGLSVDGEGSLGSELRGGYVVDSGSQNGDFRVCEPYVGVSNRFKNSYLASDHRVSNFSFTYRSRSLWCSGFMPWSVIVFLIVFLLIYEPLVLVVSAGNPNSNSKIRKAKSDAAENVLGSKTKSSQERDPPGALAAKSSTDDSDDFLEEKYGVRYPTPCETCRLLTLELDARLRETGKTSETLGTVSSGHKKYAVSELRFIESLEGLCQRMLGYSLHKEFNDVRRFAKGQSETMKTLQNLVAKGVKVDIGIPGQLWDEPSAEVAHLKTACEGMLERYEEDLEEWYHAGMGVPLADFLCSEQRALRGGEDPSCLTVDLTDRRRPSPPAKTAETGTKKQEL